MTPGEAFLGLGSNLGDRLQNIRRALGALDAAGVQVREVSSVYETEPVGPPQPLYLNAVCRVTTHLSPPALLVMLKKIEKQMGRTPSERWGPRVIDLDILLFGSEAFDSPDLIIPHTQLRRRPFVLAPLFEIAPQAKLPSGEDLFAPGDDFRQMQPSAPADSLWPAPPKPPAREDAEPDPAPPVDPGAEDGR